MKIGDVDISKRTFVIAEIGNNHNGNFDTAVEMIKKASEAGADAVKLQVFRAEGLVVKSAPSHLPHLTGKESIFERYKSLEFSKKELEKLADLAEKIDLVFFASVFDLESADMIENIVPVYKIASCDINNLPLIRHLVKKGKTIIVSTGMAALDEIRDATKEISKDKLILLHCVSRYPTPIENANIRSIPFLYREFGVPVGYSDHTIGATACKVAVSLGAVLIEKHFTLDKKQPVGDHMLSMDPSDLKELVKAVRDIERSLGVYGKALSEEEQHVAGGMRRSLYAKIKIPKGSVVKAEMVVALRPSGGLLPKELYKLLGKKAKTDIEKDSLLSMDMFLP